MWRGALFLADYILFQWDLFQGCTVLELGAGTGLASIIAATVAQTVYCTGNAHHLTACPDCKMSEGVKLEVGHWLLVILPSCCTGLLNNVRMTQQDPLLSDSRTQQVQDHFHLRRCQQLCQ